jgi:hypothetical protein
MDDESLDLGLEVTVPGLFQVRAKNLSDSAAVAD